VVRVLALVVGERPIGAVRRLLVVAQGRLVAAVHLAVAAVAVAAASVVVLQVVVAVALAVVQEDLLPARVVEHPEEAVPRSDVRAGVVAISKSSSQVR
jgi:hypothetical protein